MIQRIQTLFLIAAAVLSGLLMTGDLLLLNNSTGTIFSHGCSEASERPTEILFSVFGH